jgi:hypothetical protein
MHQELKRDAAAQRDMLEAARRGGEGLSEPFPGVGAPSLAFDPSDTFRFHPTDVRLQQSLVVAANFRPRNLKWLKAILQRLYLHKLRLDKQARSEGVPVRSVPDAFVSFLLQTTSEVEEEEEEEEGEDATDEFLRRESTSASAPPPPLAPSFERQQAITRKACELMLTLVKYEETDPTASIWSHFLSEVWGVKVFDVYTRGRRECKKSKADLGVPRDPKDDVDQLGWFVEYKKLKDVLCLERCVAVAEDLLGFRGPAPTAAFVALLRQLAKPADHSDSDVFKKQTGEEPPRPLFRLNKEVFLQQVLRELVRMERVLVRATTSVFSGWDVDLKGRLNQQELLNLCQAMLAATGDLVTNPQAEAVKLWKAAWAADAANGVTPSGTVEYGPEITLMGFRVAAEDALVVRRYIRLQHTPPVTPPLQLSTAVAMDSYLLVATARHVRVLGACWQRVLPSMEAEEPIARCLLALPSGAKTGCEALIR